MKRLGLLVALALTLSLPAAAADSFTIILQDATTGQLWWNADYARALPSGASWTDGDRAGYKCAYAFLMHNGKVVGRVTFTRVPGAASYAKVNDRYMEEGARHYATGAPASSHDPVSQSECPAPDIAYVPYNGPDQRPVVTYATARGKLLETRDYTKLLVGDGVTFQQVSATPQRITVVAYKDGLPVIVVYYDSMIPSVVMGSSL